MILNNENKLRGKSSFTKIVFFSLFLICLTMIFSSSTSHAATTNGSVIYVNGSSGKDTNDGYTWSTAKLTINNAVNTVSNGGTVNIANGIYTGSGNTNIIIRNNMTITGENQNDTSIMGPGQIFTIQSNKTVTIENLELTQGLTDNMGGAIYNEGNLTIINCSITNSLSKHHGGAICNKGTLTILNTTIKGNIGFSSGGGIYNYGTLTVNNSNIINNEAVGIGGGIANDGTLIVTNSIINNNTSIGNFEGGGIYNSGNLTVTNSSINYNSAYVGGGIYNSGSANITGSQINYNTILFGGGGGIYNFKGTITVNSSSINNNSADEGDGGGIYNCVNGTINVNYSNIKSNSATNIGGGIRNGGNLTITGCDFVSNKSNNGNAIFNTSTLIAHFNRFYDTATGYEIYSGVTSDAKYNWWGSNSSPSSKVTSNVNVTPWIILKIGSTLTTIKNGITSKITANLLYDSNGTYHNPLSGHTINGLSVSFTTTLGSIIKSSTLTNGMATTTLIGGLTSGYATVTAQLNNQSVIQKVLIDNISPTVSSSNPTTGATGIDRDKAITITFNENIKTNSSYNIILKASNGTTITITKSISGKVLTITHSSKLAANTKYTLTLYTGSITDQAGNPIATKTITFTTGST